MHSADHVKCVIMHHRISLKTFKLKLLLHQIGEQNGRFFRRNIDTLLRNKEVLVADLIQEAAECMTEDVMDRRASSPPPVYVPYVPQTSESNTAIFKENEKFNAELAANSC